MSLQFPYSLLHAQNWQQDVRGTVLGCCCLHIILLPLAYHVLIISLLIATCPELTARCEGDCFGLLLLAYYFITNCLPYPYHVLTNRYMHRIKRKMWGEPFFACWAWCAISLAIAYHVLTNCYMQRIESKICGDHFVVSGDSKAPDQIADNMWGEPFCGTWR